MSNLKSILPVLLFLGAPCAVFSQSGGIADPGATQNILAAGIVAPGALLQKLADGFSFTEGPATDAHGNVFFTDQPGDRILKWSIEGELSIFLSPSGRSNGMYFASDGNLISAADAVNELWSIAPDGSHTVLARGFDDGSDNGHGEFNGPNDLWIHPASGDIYFTDPLYARPWWSHRTDQKQQDGEHVYRLDRATGKVVRVADDLEKPNGIVGTPDGKTLYIADIGAGKTYAYDIAPDGSLAGKRLFAPMGSDGMTIDERGNVYVTGRGVTVFNPAGERIEHIEVPSDWTANVVFGGPQHDLLFITATDAVYGLEMNVRGVKQ